MISAQFLLTRFFRDFWRLPANRAVTLTARRYLNRLSMNCRTSTAHFLLWLKNPTLFRRNYTAIQTSYIREARRSFITTVRITTLKPRRMMILESMEKAKKTDQIPSLQWASLSSARMPDLEVNQTADLAALETISLPVYSLLEKKLGN